MLNPPFNGVIRTLEQTFTSQKKTIQLCCGILGAAPPLGSVKFWIRGLLLTSPCARLSLWSIWMEIVGRVYLYTNSLLLRKGKKVKK